MATENINVMMSSPPPTFESVKRRGTTTPLSQRKSLAKRRLALSPISQQETNNRKFSFLSPLNQSKNEPVFSPPKVLSPKPQDDPAFVEPSSNRKILPVLHDDDSGDHDIQTSSVSKEGQYSPLAEHMNSIHITNRKRTTSNIQELHSDLTHVDNQSLSFTASLSPNVSDIEEEISISDFEYPASVPFPSKKILRYCYNLAMKKNEGENLTLDNNLCNFSSLSHQQQLKLYGCNLLSLEDVIIPSIVKCHNHELIKHQSKSQRDKNECNTNIIKSCRVAIQTSAVQAIQSIRDYRFKWEENEDIKFKQKLQEEKEKQKQERQKRRIQKAENRKKEKELRFQKKKKNWGKNKELWVEVAQLMTDLGVLRKEEKLWKDVIDNTNFNQLAALPATTTVDELEEDNDKKIDMSFDQPIKNSVEDVVLAANRINDALSTIVELMKKSDSIRKEVYDKYGKDHKFHGYRAVKNPKALIRALALC